MRTDWALIARLAQEIDERFRGARAQDVGETADGRFAISFWTRGQSTLLCADIFAPAPLLTVESGELPAHTESAFARSAGRALRGLSLARAGSVDRERMLELEFVKRSRFGVEDRYTLLYELVPRFGNIVLLKRSGETGERVVVSALKEFKPGRGQRGRETRAGLPYQPPPPRTAASQPALEENAGGSVLDLFGKWRMESQGQRSDAGAEKRRTALAQMLADRRKKLQSELQRLEAQLTQIAARDAIRADAEAIYAGLHEIEERKRDSAKQRAAALFDEYKRLGSAFEHAVQRQSATRQALTDLDELEWEVHRADDAALDEIARTIERPKQRSAKQKPANAKKRKPLVFSLSSGTRIFVGRSPLENAELTFRIARPEDLWFHARGQPGAHVILQRDDRSEPSGADIESAAALAAFHSKGRTSAKVAVDYTQRKHVRKRPASAPGLVFYTAAKTIMVTPSAEAISTR